MSVALLGPSVSAGVWTTLEVRGDIEVWNKGPRHRSWAWCMEDRPGRGIWLHPMPGESSALPIAFRLTGKAENSRVPKFRSVSPILQVVHKSIRSNSVVRAARVALSSTR